MNALLPPPASPACPPSAHHPEAPLGNGFTRTAACCRRFVFVFVCVLQLAGAARAGELELVSHGVSRATIFQPPELDRIDWSKPVPPVPWVEAEAERQRRRLSVSVADLARTLGKISGAEIKIVSGRPPADFGASAILVGSIAVAEFGAPSVTYPFKQGFRYVVAGRKVGLLGESDLAVSYAIYELLERLGCRWFMPGDLGEVLPSTADIRLPEVDFSSAPGTIYRGIWYCDDLYRFRNRMGGLAVSAGHALEGYVSDEQRAAHPEWVAEVGGKPHKRRLKWSNPEVADAISAHWLERLAKNPQPTVSVSPDDGIDFDESAADRALDAGDFDTTSQEVSLTDRLLVLCNRVAAGVGKVYPDVRFGMLAYGPTTRPPVREKTHPAIVPQIAPITYSRAHPMSDDAVPDNPQLRQLFEGWGRVVPATSVYFYGWFLAEPSAPNPMLAKWSYDVPFVLRHKCKYWQPETLPNFESCMHALYLGNRLAWNPALQPAAVLSELNSAFYGAAAGPMGAYWEFIDRCWTDVPEYSGCGFGYLRRWTPERMAEARRLLDSAAAATATRTEAARIRLADDSLELFETFMKLRRDLAEGRFANLAAEAGYWRGRIAHLGEKHAAQYAFTRVPYNLKTLSGSYFAQFYQKTYEDATRIAGKDFATLTPHPLREFRFAKDAENRGEGEGWMAPGFDDSAWPKTDVAAETWSSIGLHAWFKSVWYRSEFRLAASVPKGKRVYLWLGATDGSVKVFLNGKPVSCVDAKGEVHETFTGYCEPVSFDITEAVKPGGANSVAVLATRTFFNELGTGGLLAPLVVYREK